MGEPPSSPGAVKETETEALPAVVAPIVGAPGTVAGVTLFDGADGGPPPTLLVAITSQVTATPFARPVTTIGDVAPNPLCEPHVAV